MRLIRYCILGLLLSLATSGRGQSALLFKKNNRRQALYHVGDVLTFNLKNNDSRYTEQIHGFEDSLIVFPYFKINPRDITHLYVDEKTRVWYIIRYKYEKLFLIGGIGLPALDVVNSGQVRPRALLLGGGLLGASLLTRWLISKRIPIKGRRHFVILNG